MYRSSYIIRLEQKQMSCSVVNEHLAPQKRWQKTYEVGADGNK